MASYDYMPTIYVTATDDGEFYCLECNKVFYLRDFPAEMPPDTPQDDTEREELELLII